MWNHFLHQLKDLLLKMIGKDCPSIPNSCGHLFSYNITGSVATIPYFTHGAGFKNCILLLNLMLIIIVDCMQKVFKSCNFKFCFSVNRIDDVSILHVKWREFLLSVFRFYVVDDEWFLKIVKVNNFYKHYSQNFSSVLFWNSRHGFEFSW